MDKLLSVKDASVSLAVSEAMIRKWLQKGRLPFVKVGRLTRVRQSDLEAWMRLGLRGGRRQK